MTKEEIEQYCSEKEPTEILTDKVGRWINRVWQLENSKIIESYTYQYDEATLLENKDITKYRNAFAVQSVNREEVANG